MDGLIGMMPTLPPPGRLFDLAIRHTGPLFVAIGVVLIAWCTIVHFALVIPLNHAVIEDGGGSRGANIAYHLDVAFSAYMVICIFFHYYKAIVTDPGYVRPGEAEIVSAKLGQIITDNQVCTCSL